ncbi:hypothetical protein GWI33_015227 [Rhynchophorus ferrugineus]|uniref:Closca n=1 Tax=Rhynchophorus ferrugineus TaxID=354439 RepID=A0A834I130_RHYFE|nr:hypothetical protein GWI33_015227 [Rhynchophorus ferrugineus]
MSGTAPKPVSKSLFLRRKVNGLENYQRQSNINIGTYILSENSISTRQLKSIRIFEAKLNLFAVALQADKLTFYKLSNTIFEIVLQNDIFYATHLTLLSFNNLNLVIVGRKNGVHVYNYDVDKNRLQSLQILKITQIVHLNIWEQDDGVYMAVLYQSNLPNPNDKTSFITVYRWSHSYFDMLQTLQLFNVKKSVQFSIHGSSFLVAVKEKPHEDELKSFSDIFKYDVHDRKFVLHQRLLTNCGTNIKYFISELHDENHHFLITASTVCQGNNQNKYTTVLYKYEDQYFIPFQRIHTDAVEWQSIQDGHGRAALIALTPHALRGFQYDGWQFIENDISADSLTKNELENITTIHAFAYQGNEYLITICDHCKHNINIYKVTFTNYNHMQEEYSDMLSWCTSKLNELQSSNEAANELVGEALRGDLNEKVFPEEELKRQLVDTLEESSSYQVLSGDVEAETIIFNNHSSIVSLKSVLVNNIKIDDILNNSMDINEGFKIGKNLAFNITRVDHSLDPLSINNIPFDQYVHVLQDKHLDLLKVSGSITFQEGVDVSGTINNMVVRDNALLIDDRDQEFSTNLRANELNVQNLSTKYINGFDFDDLKPRPISHLDVLEVKDLNIRGLINGVNLPFLSKRVLRSIGDQLLSDDLIVDSVEADQLMIYGMLSGKNISKDFVNTRAGDFVVNTNVYFQKGLVSNKLEIMNSLNNITVTNGELDILMENNGNPTIMKSTKIFDNVFITNPIIKRYKIKNKRMQMVNPVKLISDTLEIDGDVTIEGDAHVLHSLKAKDVAGQHGPGLKKVLTKAVKLNSTQLEPKLIFDYPLDLEDIFADKVNGYNTDDWLLKKFDETQTISGKKTFVHDVHLDGPVNVFYLNGIDVQALQNRLRLDGNQIIEEDVEVDEVIADSGISSSNTYFGLELWKDTQIFNKNDRNMLTINDSFPHHIKAKNVTVQGLVNGKKLENVVKNLVPLEPEFKVLSEKTFKDLHVKQLFIKNPDSDLLNTLRFVENSTVTLEDNLDVYFNLSVENIHFNGRINNLTEEDFEKIVEMKMTHLEDIIAPPNKEYGEILVRGTTFINDSNINGISLDTLANDSVKIDEDHHFNRVEIVQSIIVESVLNLDGNIEKFDLDNIVVQQSNGTLILSDKTFESDVFVQGSLDIPNTVNGHDFGAFCAMCKDYKAKTFHIKGKTIFAKGPMIKNVNNLNVNKLSKQIWFTDKFTNITDIAMDNVVFEKSLDVKEYIDGIKLNIISQNYLSKTRPQNITSNLSFEHVTFSNISSALLNITGPINGVALNGLLQTVLLQDVDQLFENPVYFENLQVEDVDKQNVYRVNDLDLEREVMLYDQKNIVTGNKYIHNLKVDKLTIKNNSHIQNVDLLDWMKNALLKNGTFEVPARKKIQRAIFRGNLSLRGTLDNQEFNKDSVLLSNTIQTISGKKIFHSPNGEVVKFQNLKVKGLINNINLHELVHDQSNKIKNNILNSKIHFNNSIMVKNINVEYMFDDVNVTELLRNITEVGILENYRDKFAKLLEIGTEDELSIKDQSSFFKYFKEIMHLDGIYEIFGIRCMDGVFRIITFSYYNQENIIRTYEWNKHENKFVLSGTLHESSHLPTFIEQVSDKENNYIYIEHGPDSHIIGGYLLRFLNGQTSEIVYSFPNNTTRALISFTQPDTNQFCLGFVSQDNVKILCDEPEFYLLQTIVISIMYKATVVADDQSLYLILVRRQPNTFESIIEVLKKGPDQNVFIPIQSIYETAEVNDLSATVIDGLPYLALSLSSQENTVNIGRISIRRLDPSQNQFVPHQYIPLASPIDVKFISKASFETLLVATSGDSSIPCPTFRYDGIAGFNMLLKGATLPIHSHLKLFTKPNVLAVLHQNTAIILGAVTKGAMNI